MCTRALSLDALRGYAILTMVLSGTMAMQHLPGWMAHAQVPPMLPFDPSIAGITWVDLVFPFFLFAMGAAFPFSIGRKLQRGHSRLRIASDMLWRAVQLVFFAIFLQHLKPFVISEPQDTQAWLLSLGAFALLFPMLGQLPKRMAWRWRLAIKLAAYAVALLLMWAIPYHSGRQFDVAFSDIIIIVLANMALFGGLIYMFTYKQPVWRVAVLPFVMAIFLGSEQEGWVKAIYEFSPIPWAYKFYYLKYLFVVIPGTLAGEYLYTCSKGCVPEQATHSRVRLRPLVLLVSALALIVVNVVCLYTRCLLVNMVVSVVLLVAMWCAASKAHGVPGVLWRKLVAAAAYCLLLGLFLEAYQGGIHKDPSTYSYYFVSSGLAFAALLFFYLVFDYYQWIRPLRFLAHVGQNPMVAYVAPALLVMPLLHLCGIARWFGVFSTNAFTGVLQGLLITALVVLCTLCCTRWRWYWRA